MSPTTKHTSLRRPRRPERFLDTQRAQFLAALLVSVVVALAVREKIGHLSFWTTTLGALFGTLFLLNYLRTVLLVPPPEDEIAQPDPARLTSSITSAIRSTYAISSNWVTLWRSPNFRYYLHLDAVASLIAYSFRFDASLLRLSKDEADLKDFFEYGRRLVADIAAGTYPVHKHRLRLLIYPEWVYEDYRSEIEQLIRSHSAARIPCVPVVADTLERRLSDHERDRIRRLVRNVRQTTLDKSRPRAPLLAWLVMRRLKWNILARPEWKVVFPDMLLVDAGVAHDTSAVWWYSSRGDINRAGYDEPASEYSEAEEVFRIICRHAFASAWSGYAPESLGGVALGASSGRLDSEAFFARDYYDVWLRWIEEHKRSDAHARDIAEWISEERKLLSGFVRKAVPEATNTGTEPRNSVRMVDLGCGTGRHLIEVLRATDAVHGVGVDIIERNISEGVRRVHQAGLGERAAMFVGDAATLSDFDDDEFDLAICLTNTLGNLPPDKQEGLLRRLRAVLRVGGRALLSVYSDASVRARTATYEAIGLHVEERGDHIVAWEGLRSEHFTAEDLRQLVEHSGLKVEGEIDRVASIGLAVVAYKSG
jgi:SAM-dependent methyltransferase